MQPDTHEGMLRAADAGCLLIADISGYTSYLGATELEHAQDVLADLTETVVRSLQKTLRIAEIEGDAVFAYALAGELEGAMLLDTVDQSYFAFRSRRRDVTRATACTCEACRRIPALDLKYVVHDGRFVRSTIGGREKPAGTDVVIAHRLLKNTVRDQLGLEAYALFTAACVDTLGLDPDALGWVAHQERYDDVGEVACYVEDLDARWQAEQEQRRVFVSPDEAQFELTRVFAVPAAVLWDWQTSPQKRLQWQTDFERIEEDTKGGRRGPGTVNHCVHGRGAVTEEILDWRPYRYLTERITMPMIGPWTFTTEFVELADDRTELRIRAERLAGRQRLLWAVMRRMMLSGLGKNLDRLEQVLAGSRL
jgi:uncharacterized protein YndB with AHSA1/START domain